MKIEAPQSDNGLLTITPLTVLQRVAIRSVVECETYADLLEVLKSFKTWVWDRGDLVCWAPIFNLFDQILEEYIAASGLLTVPGNNPDAYSHLFDSEDGLPIMHHCKPGLSVELVEEVLRVTHLILESCAAKPMYNSFDRIVVLLDSLDEHILKGAIPVAMMHAFAARKARKIVDSASLSEIQSRLAIIANSPASAVENVVLQDPASSPVQAQQQSTSSSSPVTSSTTSSVKATSDGTDIFNKLSIKMNPLVFYNDSSWQPDPNAKISLVSTVPETQEASSCSFTNSQLLRLLATSPRPKSSPVNTLQSPPLSSSASSAPPEGPPRQVQANPKLEVDRARNVQLYHLAQEYNIPPSQVRHLRHRVRVLLGATHSLAARRCLVDVELFALMSLLTISPTNLQVHIAINYHLLLEAAYLLRCHRHISYQTLVIVIDFWVTMLHERVQYRAVLAHLELCAPHGLLADLLRLYLGSKSLYPPGAFEDSPLPELLDEVPATPPPDGETSASDAATNLPSRATDVIADSSRTDQPELKETVVYSPAVAASSPVLPKTNIVVKEETAVCPSSEVICDSCVKYQKFKSVEGGSSDKIQVLVDCDQQAHCHCDVVTAILDLYHEAYQSSVSAVNALTHPSLVAAVLSVLEVRDYRYLQAQVSAMRLVESFYVGPSSSLRALLRELQAVNRAGARTRYEAAKVYSLLQTAKRYGIDVEGALKPQSDYVEESQVQEEMKRFHIGKGVPTVWTCYKGDNAFDYFFWQIFEELANRKCLLVASLKEGPFSENWMSQVGADVTGNLGHSFIKQYGLAIRLIFRNPEYFGYPVYASAVQLLHDLISEEPAVEEQLVSADVIPEFFLSMSDPVLKSESSLNVIPSAVSVSFLHSSALEVARELAYKPLVSLITVVNSPVLVHFDRVSGITSLIGSTLEGIVRNSNDIQQVVADTIIKLLDTTITECKGLKRWKVKNATEVFELVCHQLNVNKPCTTDDLVLPKSSNEGYFPDRLSNLSRCIHSFAQPSGSLRALIHRGILYRLFKLCGVSLTPFKDVPSLPPYFLHVSLTHPANSLLRQVVTSAISLGPVVTPLTEELFGGADDKGLGYLPRLCFQTANRVLSLISTIERRTTNLRHWLALDRNVDGTYNWETSDGMSEVSVQEKQAITELRKQLLEAFSALGSALHVIISVNRDVSLFSTMTALSVKSTYANIILSALAGLTPLLTPIFDYFLRKLYEQAELTGDCPILLGLRASLHEHPNVRTNKLFMRRYQHQPSLNSICFRLPGVDPICAGINRVNIGSNFFLWTSLSTFCFSSGNPALELGVQDESNLIYSSSSEPMDPKRPSISEGVNPWDSSRVMKESMRILCLCLRSYLTSCARVANSSTSTRRQNGRISHAVDFTVTQKLLALQIGTGAMRLMSGFPDWPNPLPHTAVENPIETEPSLTDARADPIVPEALVVVGDSEAERHDYCLRLIGMSRRVAEILDILYRLHVDDRTQGSLLAVTVDAFWKIGGFARVFKCVRFVLNFQHALSMEVVRRIRSDPTFDKQKWLSPDVVRRMKEIVKVREISVSEDYLAYSNVNEDWKRWQVYLSKKLMSTLSDDELSVSLLILDKCVQSCLSYCEKVTSWKRMFNSSSASHLQRASRRPDGPMTYAEAATAAAAPSPQAEPAPLTEPTDPPAERQPDTPKSLGDEMLEAMSVFCGTRLLETIQLHVGKDLLGWWLLIANETRAPYGSVTTDIDLRQYLAKRSLHQEVSSFFLCNRAVSSLFRTLHHLVDSQSPARKSHAAGWLDVHGPTVDPPSNTEADVIASSLGFVPLRSEVAPAVDDAMLSLEEALTEMGFAVGRVRQALSQTGGEGIEAATEWLIAHAGEEPEAAEDGPTTEPQSEGYTEARATASDAVDEPNSIDKLVADYQLVSSNVDVAKTRFRKIMIKSLALCAVSLLSDTDQAGFEYFTPLLMVSEILLREAGIKTEDEAYEDVEELGVLRHSALRLERRGSVEEIRRLLERAHDPNVYPQKVEPYINSKCVVDLVSCLRRLIVRSSIMGICSLPSRIPAIGDAFLKLISLPVHVSPEAVPVISGREDAEDIIDKNVTAAVKATLQHLSDLLDPLELWASSKALDLQVPSQVCEVLMNNRHVGRSLSRDRDIRALQCEFLSARELEAVELEMLYEAKGLSESVRAASTLHDELQGALALLYQLFGNYPKRAKQAAMCVMSSLQGPRHFLTPLHLLLAILRIFTEVNGTSVFSPQDKGLLKRRKPGHDLLLPIPIWAATPEPMNVYQSVLVDEDQQTAMSVTDKFRCRVPDGRHGVSYGVAESPLCAKPPKWAASLVLCMTELLPLFESMLPATQAEIEKEMSDNAPSQQTEQEDSVIQRWFLPEDIQKQMVTSCLDLLMLYPGLDSSLSLAIFQLITPLTVHHRNSVALLQYRGHDTSNKAETWIGGGLGLLLRLPRTAQFPGCLKAIATLCCNLLEDAGILAIILKQTIIAVFKKKGIPVVKRSLNGSAEAATVAVNSEDNAPPSVMSLPPAASAQVSAPPPGTTAPAAIAEPVSYVLPLEELLASCYTVARRSPNLFESLICLMCAERVEELSGDVVAAAEKTEIETSEAERLSETAEKKKIGIEDIQNWRKLTSDKTAHKLVFLQLLDNDEIDANMEETPHGRKIKKLLNCGGRPPIAAWVTMSAISIHLQTTAHLLACSRWVPFTVVQNAVDSAAPQSTRNGSGTLSERLPLSLPPPLLPRLIKPEPAQMDEFLNRLPCTPGCQGCLNNVTQQSGTCDDYTKPNALFPFAFAPISLVYVLHVLLVAFPGLLPYLARVPPTSLVETFQESLRLQEPKSNATEDGSIDIASPRNNSRDPDSNDDGPHVITNTLPYPPPWYFSNLLSAPAMCNSPQPPVPLFRYLWKKSVRVFMTLSLPVYSDSRAPAPNCIGAKITTNNVIVAPKEFHALSSSSMTSCLSPSVAMLLRLASFFATAALGNIDIRRRLIYEVVAQAKHLASAKLSNRVKTPTTTTSNKMVLSRVGSVGYSGSRSEGKVVRYDSFVLGIFFISNIALRLLQLPAPVIPSESKSKLTTTPSAQTFTVVGASFSKQDLGVLKQCYVKILGRLNLNRDDSVVISHIIVRCLEMLCRPQFVDMPAPLPSSTMTVATAPQQKKEPSTHPATAPPRRSGPPIILGASSDENMSSSHHDDEADEDDDDRSHSSSSSLGEEEDYFNEFMVEEFDEMWDRWAEDDEDAGASFEGEHDLEDDDDDDEQSLYGGDHHHTHHHHHHHHHDAEGDDDDDDVEDEDEEDEEEEDEALEEPNILNPPALPHEAEDNEEPSIQLPTGDTALATRLDDTMTDEDHGTLSADLGVEGLEVIEETYDEDEAEVPRVRDDDEDDLFEDGGVHSTDELGLLQEGGDQDPEVDNSTLNSPRPAFAAMTDTGDRETPQNHLGFGNWPPALELSDLINHLGGNTTSATETAPVQNQAGARDEGESENDDDPDHHRTGGGEEEDEELDEDEEEDEEEEEDEALLRRLLRSADASGAAQSSVALGSLEEDGGHPTNRRRLWHPHRHAPLVLNEVPEGFPTGDGSIHVNLFGVDDMLSDGVEGVVAGGRRRPHGPSGLLRPNGPGGDPSFTLEGTEIRPSFDGLPNLLTAASSGVVIAPAPVDPGSRFARDVLTRARDASTLRQNNSNGWAVARDLHLPPQHPLARAWTTNLTDSNTTQGNGTQSGNVGSSTGTSGNTGAPRQTASNVGSQLILLPENSWTVSSEFTMLRHPLFNASESATESTFFIRYWNPWTARTLEDESVTVTTTSRSMSLPLSVERAALWQRVRALATGEVVSSVNPFAARLLEDGYYTRRAGDQPRAPGTTTPAATTPAATTPAATTPAATTPAASEHTDMADTETLKLDEPTLPDLISNHDINHRSSACFHELLRRGIMKKLRRGGLKSLHVDVDLSHTLPLTTAPPPVETPTEPAAFVTPAAEPAAPATEQVQEEGGNQSQSGSDSSGSSSSSSSAESDDEAQETEAPEPMGEPSAEEPAAVAEPQQELAAPAEEDALPPLHGMRLAEICEMFDMMEERQFQESTRPTDPSFGISGLRPLAQCLGITRRQLLDMCSIDSDFLEALPLSYRQEAIVLQLTLLPEDRLRVLQTENRAVFTAARGADATPALEANQIAETARAPTIFETTTAAEQAPTEQAPTERAPTERAPTEQVPTEQVPTEQVPTEQAPTEQAPTEQAPTEQAPTEQAPTEQAPTEQAPTEQAPTEQAPTEQAPTESAPTESALTEPALTELASTERGPTERASTERASTERASTERASTERASTERASTERVSTEQVPTVQVPTVQVPTVQVPTVQVPTVQVPAVPVSVVQASTGQGSTEQAPIEQGPTEQGPIEQGTNEQGPNEQGPNEQGPNEQGPAEQAPAAPTRPLPTLTAIPRMLFEALPPAVRNHVSAITTPEDTVRRSTGAVDMDNASFLATLDPALRREVLLSATDDFLETLPPAFYAEAQEVRGRPAPAATVTATERTTRSLARRGWGRWRPGGGDRDAPAGDVVTHIAHHVFPQPGAPGAPAEITLFLGQPLGNTDALGATSRVPSAPPSARQLVSRNDAGATPNTSSFFSLFSQLVTAAQMTSPPGSVPTVVFSARPREEGETHPSDPAADVRSFVLDLSSVWNSLEDQGGNRRGNRRQIRPPSQRRHAAPSNGPNNPGLGFLGFNTVSPLRAALLSFAAGASNHEVMGRTQSAALAAGVQAAVVFNVPTSQITPSPQSSSSSAAATPTRARNDDKESTVAVLLPLSLVVEPLDWTTSMSCAVDPPLSPLAINLLCRLFFFSKQINRRDLHRMLFGLTLSHPYCRSQLLQNFLLILWDTTQDQHTKQTPARSHAAQLLDFPPSHLYQIASQSLSQDCATWAVSNQTSKPIVSYRVLEHLRSLFSVNPLIAEFFCQPVSHPSHFNPSVWEDCKGNVTNTIVEEVAQQPPDQPTQVPEDDEAVLLNEVRRKRGRQETPSQRALAPTTPKKTLAKIGGKKDAGPMESVYSINTLIRMLSSSFFQTKANHLAHLYLAISFLVLGPSHNSLSETETGSAEGGTTGGVTSPRRESSPAGGGTDDATGSQTADAAGTSVSHVATEDGGSGVAQTSSLSVHDRIIDVISEEAGEILIQTFVWGPDGRALIKFEGDRQDESISFGVDREESSLWLAIQGSGTMSATFTSNLINGHVATAKMIGKLIEHSKHSGWAYRLLKLNVVGLFNKVTELLQRTSQSLGFASDITFSSPVKSKPPTPSKQITTLESSTSLLAFKTDLLLSLMPRVTGGIQAVFRQPTKLCVKPLPDHLVYAKKNKNRSSRSQRPTEAPTAEADEIPTSTQEPVPNSRPAPLDCALTRVANFFKDISGESSIWETLDQTLRDIAQAFPQLAYVPASDEAVSDEDVGEHPTPVAANATEHARGRPARRRRRRTGVNSRGATLPPESQSVHTFGVASPLPVVLNRLVPLIETYMYLEFIGVSAELECYSVHPSFLASPGSVAANKAPSTPSVWCTAKGRHISVSVFKTAALHELYTELRKRLGDPELPLTPSHDRFIAFCEIHQKPLNGLMRQMPQLLMSSFNPMIHLAPMHVWFDNKRHFFRQQIRQSREGMRFDPIRLLVRRSHVFVDSYHQLRGKDLKGRLIVNFQSEEGVDGGGLTREWYSILSREMFNPDYALFRREGSKSEFNHPNPLSHVNPDHLHFFKFIGMVIGKALYDGQYLDCYFTRPFYKLMLGRKIAPQDAESIDPEFYRNLQTILEHPVEMLGLELSFTTDVDEFGKTTVVELKPGGAQIPVTDENKHEYVKLMCEHKIMHGLDAQLEAFFEGFNELMPPELLSIFDDKELELLISGLPQIDLPDLKAHTEYRGYLPTDDQIKWFWEILEEMDQNQLATFLQFATGTSKVPLGGFQNLMGMRGPQRFVIVQAYGQDRLPAAHTCFNQLDLPNYETKDLMKQKLILAITEGKEGFGFA